MYKKYRRPKLKYIGHSVHRCTFLSRERWKVGGISKEGKFPGFAILDNIQALVSSINIFEIFKVDLSSTA